jgi:hypothetical protein
MRMTPSPAAEIIDGDTLPSAGLHGLEPKNESVKKELV